MMRLYLISLVTTLWLFCAANAYSDVSFKEPANAAKATAAETSLSAAFSSSDAEIELTVIQLFKPAHNTVERKEPFNSPVAGDCTVAGFSFNKSHSGELLAVSAAKNYKLLFPFHHFW